MFPNFIIHFNNSLNRHFLVFSNGSMNWCPVVRISFVYVRSIENQNVENVLASFRVFREYVHDEVHWGVAV